MVNKFSIVSIINLWLSCDVCYKIKLNNDLKEKISNIPIEYFSLDENNKYKYVKGNLGEILPLTEDEYFLNINSFILETVEGIKKVSDILNRIPVNVKKNKLILNRYSMNFIQNLYYKDLYFEEKDKLTIFTVYLEDELIDPKKYVINLFKESKNLMLSYLGRRSDNHRYCIPAISMYENIAVDLLGKSIPPGFRIEYNIKLKAYIIAPFTGIQAEKRKIYSKSCFIDEICSLGTFNKCVEFTKKYAVYKDVSIDNIRETYKQLIGDYYDAMDDSYDKQNNLSDSK